MHHSSRIAMSCLMVTTVACTNSLANDRSKYRLVDPDLKVVHIDSSQT